jgi:hypothetical protein
LYQYGPGRDWIHHVGKSIGKSMKTQRRPLVQIVGFVTGLLLLGIGLYTGMNGAIAIGMILATLNAVIWMRDRNAKQPD